MTTWPNWTYVVLGAAGLLLLLGLATAHILVPSFFVLDGSATW